MKRTTCQGFGAEAAGVTPDSKPPSVMMFVDGQVRGSIGEEVIGGTIAKRKDRR